MSEPFDIASAYVDRLAELHPALATSLGIPGHDHEWPPMTPDWHEELAAVTRSTRAKLEPHVEHPERAQRLCARVVTSYLDERIDGFEHGDHLRDLRHMASPLQMIRNIFDLMDKSSEAGWENIASRLENVGDAFEGYRATLQTGIDAGLVTSRRQVLAAVDQTRDLAGERSAWLGLISQAESRQIDHLIPRLEQAVGRARSEAARFGDWLASSYLPRAEPADGVGPERYARSAERIVGLGLDAREVYEWGWEELARINDELREVGKEIDPDAASVAEVVHLLENDPDRAAHSPAEFVAFVRHRLEEALDELSGVHFDVPDQIRKVDVNIAPPGGALGAYYLQPSEDFSRPGGVWYSIGDQIVFPLYQEVSTAYHEGFPGHHLQIGTTMALRDRLSRAQRLLIWYSGYGEGWALYAERLMHELGYFEKPDYVFGMLASHVFRATRVVVDIGIHLGLRIPDAAPIAPGSVWDFELGVRYMNEVGLQPPDYAESDVKRYLGWPGQAISYKVGERELLDLRERARAQDPGLDLQDFHRRVLSNGEMRFELLQEVVLDPEDRWQK